MADTDTLVTTAAATTSTTTKPKTEAEKAFTKIEKPESVKDYFVNNLLTAADKVDKEYNGTVGQQLELRGILKSQAYFSKINDGFAFFDDEANEVFENGLSKKGLEVAKKVANHRLENLLPEMHNFPLDKKVANEFTAIVKSSLFTALESRAVDFGQVIANSPVTATSVDKVQLASDKKELVTVGQ